MAGQKCDDISGVETRRVQKISDSLSQVNMRSAFRGLILCGRYRNRLFHSNRYAAAGRKLDNPGRVKLLAVLRRCIQPAEYPPSLYVQLREQDSWLAESDKVLSAQ